MQPGLVRARVVDVGLAEDVGVERIPIGCRAGAKGLNDAGYVGTEDVGKLVANEEAEVSAVGVMGEDWKRLVVAMEWFFCRGRAREQGSLTDS